MASSRSWTWRMWTLAVLVLVATCAENGVLGLDSSGSGGQGASSSSALEAPGAPGTPAGKVLSRHRRYLVFPEGATFTAAACVTVKTFLIRETNIYTTGVAWGIAYDLPNNSRAIASSGAGIEPTELRRRGRRDRRDLYRRFETAANAAGLDGRACVLRAVCEARDLTSSGAEDKDRAPTSLPLELLRVMLNVPVDSVSANEPSEHHEYVSARRLGLQGGDCARHFPTCSTSFVSLAASLIPASHL